VPNAAALLGAAYISATRRRGGGRHWPPFASRAGRWVP
jgi:hypothetical protein